MGRLDRNAFLERTHIQGRDASSVALGLVACMTFGRPRFGGGWDYELIRYSSELGVNVVGGAGKLVAEFRRRHSGSIVSYSDRRWGSGELYRRLGFVLDGKTQPGFFWYDPKCQTVYGRLTRKTVGFEKVWTAGNLRWAG